MARETGWGYTRILGELKKLGIAVSRSTVVNILKAAGMETEVDPELDLIRHWRQCVVLEPFLESVMSLLAVWIGVDVIKGRSGRDGQRLNREAFPTLCERIHRVLGLVHAHKPTTTFHCSGKQLGESHRELFSILATFTQTLEPFPAKTANLLYSVLSSMTARDVSENDLSMIFDLGQKLYIPGVQLHRQSPMDRLCQRRPGISERTRPANHGAESGQKQRKSAR